VIRVGILQINAKTLWKQGGGELHARKYIEHGQCADVLVEPFNFQKPEYDIIHYFGSGHQMHDIGRHARLLGKKVFGTPILYPSSSVGKYKWALKIGKRFPFPTTLQLRKELLEESDLLVANSNPEKVYFTEAYGIPEHKIRTLGTGVEASYLSYEFKKGDLPKGVQELSDYVLMVGRITPLKNQLLVAQTLGSLGKPLVLVGQADPSEMDYIKKLEAVIEKRPNIIWLKNINADSNKLKALYAGALCHVLWSRTEVAALVNMEAAALGCLCICRNLNTSQSIMQEHASYAGNEQELIRRIDELINLSDEEKLVKRNAAQIFIRQKHIWKDLVQKNIQWYKEILSAS